MGRAIRFVILSLLSVIAVIVIALLLFINFVEANAFKPFINQQDSEMTGRNFTIQGDLALTLYPKLGIEAHDVVLSNPPGFKGKAFAKANKVEFDVKLKPLLEQKIEVGTIRINGLKLNLVTNSRGNSNWQNLKIQAPKKMSQQQDEQLFKIESFSISKLVIKMPLSH